ncbi:response regulator [Pseudooceanicola sp. LIPI14-2-Ac024]|uniref:response regulator n=1 Tax=Pseudooceanicola sp. LIPI14-2-Ac024 TaxID=3344875 RepID=UPI0035CFB666
MRVVPVMQVAPGDNPAPRHEGEFRVILLDDSDFDREHLSRICNRLGFSPDAAEDLPGFAEKTAATAYHLAIIDLRLGMGSGEDALRMLAASAAPTMPVLLTGMDDPAVADRARALGCAACMHKDRFDMAELRAVADAARRHAGLPAGAGR